MEPAAERRDDVADGQVPALPDRAAMGPAAERRDDAALEAGTLTRDGGRNGARR
jgi:hypothetical protein